MKHIIASIAILAAALAPEVAAQTTISATDQLSNLATYTINRRATSGGGYLASSTSTNAVQAGGSETAEAAAWSIHWCEAEKAYYLYNVTAGKFVGAEGGKAVLTDTPVDLRPIYVDHLSGWFFDCGGALLGLSADDSGSVLFLDDYTVVGVRSLGTLMQVATAAPVLTQAQSDAIDAKIKAGRSALFAPYQEFITKAKALAADGLTNFAGAYDTEALEAALANDSKYTIAQIEALYRAALLSRLPKAGGYYLLRNINRPGSYKTNSIGINTDGNLVSRALATPKFGTSTTNYPESLNLFCIEAEGANPYAVRIFCASTGQYVISDGSNNARVSLGDKSMATVFTLEPQADFSRPFRFRIPGDKGWLTVSGQNYFVNYNVAETPNYFYFEQVKTISVTPNAHGVAPATFPCPVTVPDDCEALIAVEEHEGKVYFEKHSGIIPAYVPFILRSPNGNAAVTVNVADENPAFKNDNVLVGTTVRIAAPNPHHAVASTAETINFTRTEPSASAVIAPNSAYLLSEATGDLTGSFDPRPNVRITEVEAEALPADAVWYDLQGRRIASPAAGALYIEATTHRLYLVK